MASLRNGMSVFGTRAVTLASSAKNPRATHALACSWRRPKLLASRRYETLRLPATATCHAGVVLTGGPGAGKTAVLELIRLFFCEHVKTLPEAAGIVFGGRFPRSDSPTVASGGAARDLPHSARARVGRRNRERRRGALRSGHGGLSRPTGLGTGDLFSAVRTTRAIELARYDTVIHLRTPTSPHAYNRDNPLRVESIEEAAAIDVRIAAEWSGHPHRLVVEPTEDFLHKAARTLALLRDEVPECCRHHVRTVLLGRWSER